MSDLSPEWAAKRTSPAPLNLWVQELDFDNSKWSYVCADVSIRLATRVGLLSIP
jgi:hypothetical protein